MKTRRVGPALQAKKGRNKAVVRDGGEVLQEEADFELTAASRYPSSFSDNPNRAAPYVPNGGMVMLALGALGGVNGSDKLIEPHCTLEWMSEL